MVKIFFGSLFLVISLRCISLEIELVDVSNKSPLRQNVAVSRDGVYYAEYNIRSNIIIKKFDDSHFRSGYVSYGASSKILRDQVFFGRTKSGESRLFSILIDDPLKEGGSVASVNIHDVSGRVLGKLVRPSLIDNEKYLYSKYLYNTISISNNGNYVALLLGSEVMVYDISSLQPLWSISHAQNDIRSLAVSDTGREVLIESRKKISLFAENSRKNREVVSELNYGPAIETSSPTFFGGLSDVIVFQDQSGIYHYDLAKEIKRRVGEYSSGVLRFLGDNDDGALIVVSRGEVEYHVLDESCDSLRFSYIDFYMDRSPEGYYSGGYVPVITHVISYDSDDNELIVGSDKINSIIKVKFLK